MEHIYIYILIGFLGGITAGMLGLGGGIIFVPGLMIIHKYYGLFSGYELQVAVYTSLISIIFAGSTSSILHYKNRLIDMSVVKKYSIYVILGSFFGIYILEHVSSELLELVYSVILIILALLLISDAKIIRNNINYLNKAGNLYFFANGSISSLMGIGGGTLSVPYLSFLIADIKRSIASASAIGLIIAVSSLFYMFVLNPSIYSEKINHIALFILIPSGILGSYAGVYLLRILNPEKVKNIFSTLLLVVAVYLLFD
ncbi:MAG: sulfite exporter TauE/SafE family protein [Gammaproteobacteria bacterium]|nr:sulfite exporter TauE/SafE family protein [Gammaproteobacteria bacterium]